MKHAFMQPLRVKPSANTVQPDNMSFHIACSCESADTLQSDNMFQFVHPAPMQPHIMSIVMIQKCVSVYSVCSCATLYAEFSANTIQPDNVFQSVQSAPPQPAYVEPSVDIVQPHNVFQFV